MSKLSQLLGDKSDPLESKYEANHKNGKEFNRINLIIKLRVNFHIFRRAITGDSRSKLSGISPRRMSCVSSF